MYTIDTAAVLFRHILDEALWQAVWEPGRPLFFGLVVPDTPTDEFGDLFLVACQRALESAASRSPFLECPKVTFVKWREVSIDEHGVTVRGARVDVLFEAAVIPCAKRLLAMEAAVLGRVLLVSGPFSRIANDKRLLALLSEMVEESPLQADMALRSVIPWTRKLTDARAIHWGTNVDLPAYVRRDRERFVLKRALSAGGDGVFIGHAIAASAWDALIERSIAEGDWVVQEWVQPDLHVEAPESDHDSQPAHLIWGAFVIGGSFAGGYARSLGSNGYSSESVEAGCIRRSANSDDCVAVFPLCWR
jgi:hypothetical protein